MRDLRIKNMPTENGFYHVTCRTGGKAFLFKEEGEKRRLLLWLGKAVEFCGVDLLSWCLMSNHIHLLVKVPPRRETTDAELDRRMRILYLPKRYDAIMEQWNAWKRMDGNNRRVDEAKAKLRRRMYDISWFMKTFKQSSAQDYNARHGYSGSIWGGTRFKSVYLEGTQKVLLSVAAYIHLNPVRAKMVDAAEQYPWSSWGEAYSCAGRSRTGLLHIYDHIASNGRVNWNFVKAQLADIQSRVTAHREALENLISAPSSAQNQLLAKAPGLSPANPTKGSEPCVPAVTNTLSARAPAFSKSLALGTAAFIQQLATRAHPQPASRRPHRQLLHVSRFDDSVLCTFGTRSLGQSPVAYTKMK